MAKSELENCLLGISEQLHAQLCGEPFETLQHSESYTIAGPHAALLLLEPVDLTMYQVGDPVALMCFADNTAATFWQFVAEVNQDGALGDKARRWSSHEASEFENYCYARMESGTSVTLSFFRGHLQLNLTNVTSASFPLISGPDVSPRIRARHQAIIDALRAHDMLQTDGPAIFEEYAKVIAWAKASRLIAPQWALLDQKCLLWMLLDLPLDSMNLRSFARRYRDPDEIRAVKTYTGQAPHSMMAEHADRIADEVHHLHNGTVKWSDIGDQHFKRFSERYALYAVVLSECFDGRAAAQCDQTLQRTVNSVLNAFRSAAYVEGHVWPDRCVSQLSNRHSVMLLIGIDQRPQLADLFDKITRRIAMEAGVNNTCFTVQIQEKLLTRSDLQKLSLVLQCSPDEVVLDTTRSLPGTGGFIMDRSEDAEHKHKLSRFRQARQVLARLQHDPSHRLTSYDVGYLDRFEGLKWKPIEEFAKPTEDEEFIPEHRVKQVRRASDHWIIWDRASKTDHTDVIPTAS